MKNVLITGGAGGLGFELVKVHLAVGFNVYALDKVITREIETLDKKNNYLHIFNCDISSTDSVKEVMGKIKREICKLERLFNNAGIFRFEDWVTLDKTDLDFVKIMVDVNAVGALRIVKEGLALLGEGTIIINTSSEAGSINNCKADVLYAYHMSKTAMNMGARIIDNELSKKGIRTICIHPGRMKTGMGGAHSEIYPSETAESLMKLLENINDIPREHMFMDYKGVLYDW